MLDVRFYGQLRRLAEDARPNAVSRRQVPVDGTLTVRQLARQLGISPTDLGHVFLNNRLLLTCSPMDLWLGYLDAQERVPEGASPWETVLQAGDRVAFFGQDMGLLVI